MNTVTGHLHKHSHNTFENKERERLDQIDSINELSKYYNQEKRDRQLED